MATPSLTPFRPMKDKLLEENPYEHVPHQGKHFTENGKRCYWTFSSATRVGERIRRRDRGWRPTGKCITEIAGEPQVIPGLGGTPVRSVFVYSPGFYYDIENDLECVEARNTTKGRIVKWVEHAPMSGAQQQAIAFQCSSAEEYEARKATP